MCGRITRGRGEEFDNGEHWQLRLVDIPIWQPSYNVAPGQLQPIVLEDTFGIRQAITMTWGLTHKDAHPSDPKTINARAETVATIPRFSVLLPRRRCIIPASGWYEWRQEGRRRQPYFAHPVGQSLFGFAGLYNAWRDADGEIHSSYCIITTRPTDGLAPLHNRMPVVLRAEDEARWLSKEVTNLGEILPLLRPYEVGPVEWWPVSRSVNDIRQNGPHLTQPHLDGAELRGTLSGQFAGVQLQQIGLFD
jgi:putative SOS response-associated peptidase YedK